MIFDTHAHYDDEQFDPDRDELLNAMSDGGVGTIVNASSTYDSWEAVMALTRKYPHVYGMLGIHPDEVGNLCEEQLIRMGQLLVSEEKLVAVGEIGLDYYWDQSDHDTQKYWFIRQMELARELMMPMNIHSRAAAADTFELLSQYGQGMKAIIHCYSYSPEMAKEYVKMGYLIGVGGVVTFKNGKKLKETVAQTPLSNLVLETDAPYLAPEPHRGERNSSLNLPLVVQAIAEIKQVSPEEVIQVTEENAKQFYQI